MSWNYGRKFSIWTPFPSNPKNPKHTGFLGSACCFMFLCVPIPPVLNTFKKALSLTARPADWWAMLNQIDFEQNIVHSCYGSIQWWVSLISKLLNFCLHLGSRKATCTSGRQSKLKTSSATMVKRMLQVQWFSCTSKNAALEKKTQINFWLVLIRWLIQPMLLDRILRPVPVHLCWKVQQYIEELQREEWLNGPHGKGWMDCGKMLWVYMKMWNKALWPAPSKGCQLNPMDGELTPFRNHLAPLWRCWDSNIWIHTLNLGILQSYLKFQVLRLLDFRKKLLQIECTFFFVACFDCFESLERTMIGATFIFTGVLQNKPDVFRSCT